MSDDFGKNVRNPVIAGPSMKEVDEMYPDHAHLHNARYNRLLADYFQCVTTYIKNYTQSEHLEQ